MAFRFFDVFLLGSTALMFVEFFVIVFGVRLGSGEHSMPQGQIAFRRPLALRIAVALFSFTVATWPLLIVGDALTHHTTISPQTWDWLILSVVASFAVSLVCVRASGPEDVVLTPDTHTYERLTGWPMYPSVRSGTWDDIVGICAVANGGSGRVYLVYILWAGQLGKTQIGRFGLRSRANPFADKVAERLGVKRINPPQ